MAKRTGDQAFMKESAFGTEPEMTYGGALSFLRRRYSRDFEGADIVVSGIPFDNAVTNRPGCRLGPRGLRQASTQLAELKAFPYGFDPFETLTVIDAGDCFVDPHHPASIVETIEEHIAGILGSGAKALTLGGDHFITYPILKAYAARFGPTALIQFDAHCDTWDDADNALDHGVMFRRAVNEGIIDTDHSIQVGLRTYNDADHGFEILTSPFVHREGITRTLEHIHQRVGDRPCYISFDIDCLDPAFAPGTGTPVTGGLASWQALELIRGLGSLDLKGFDIVEVSPPFDHAEITAIAGATLCYEWINLMAMNKGATSAPVGRL
ncbi:MAG: agmatinase [Pseudomonadota bacterium]